MPIAVSCPTCGVRLKAPDDSAGKTVKCPKCSGSMVIPTAAPPLPPPVMIPPRPAYEPVDAEPADEPRPSRRSSSGRRQYDDDRPPPSGQRRFRCPYCGSDAFPTTRSKISEAGWVVFVLLLVFCFPLFWIGLLIKESYRECTDCGMKIGG